MKNVRVPDQEEADRFIATAKRAVGQMQWTTRHVRAASTATLSLETGGLIVGTLMAIQAPGVVRGWTFKASAVGEEVLRWDFLPSGSPRRHRNPAKRPPGVPKYDRGPVHEHPTYEGRCGPLAVPIPERETNDHLQAFHWFCERATIEPGESYREPPEPQLTLIP